MTKKHSMTKMPSVSKPLKQSLLVPLDKDEEGEPKVVPKQQKAKKSFGSVKASYWVCMKGHVFRHNFRVHKDRLADLGCPECNSKASNQVSESTYLDYLKKKGRADEKTFKAKKEKEARKRSDRVQSHDDE